MANEQWVTIGKKHCDLIELNVELREKRLYTPDTLPDTPGAPFRVLQRTCTAACECNMAGVPCCHAFTNPFVDRYPE